MDNENEIDSLTIDALKEISNIAIGHLSKAISKLIKKSVSVSVPESEFLRIKNAPELVGGKSATILVGYLRVTGDAIGSMVFLMSRKDAISLTEIVMDNKVNPVFFPSPIEEEVLKNIITIMSTAYLNSINQFLGIYLSPSTPVASLFGGFNLLNFIKTREGSEEEYETEKVLAVSVRYAIENIKGKVVIMLSPFLVKYLSKEIKERV